MSFETIATIAIATLICLAIIVLSRSLQASAVVPDAPEKDQIAASPRSIEFSKAVRSLLSEFEGILGDGLILPHHDAAFKWSMNAYWAQQEREVLPACVLRPVSAEQLGKIVKILKREYMRQQEQGLLALENDRGIFAVRSGGHSPVPGAATIKGGILIDLSRFNEIVPSADGSTVTIGVGCKWGDVSRALDQKGLAVVGGRNSAVGVGGFSVGGGLSFWSPQYGFGCSNIVNHEIVLASGEIAVASATENADLWRALKGGSNNFGIVTRIVTRSFPSTDIWSGFLYTTDSQRSKVLAAFHEFINRGSSRGPDSDLYDARAAGPLACFSHVHQLNFRIISVNMVYTGLPEETGKWPACWQSSSFKPIWRFWSTCKVRSLTSATDELSSLNAPGRRQVFGTTTIKNDPATLDASYAAYRDAIASIKHVRIKGLAITLIFQPLLMQWARKGDPNPLGLDVGEQEPLVIVSFSVNWHQACDDELVKGTIRRAIEQIEAFAQANKTAHPYRYVNYTSEWQQPFEGYGHKNLKFLQEMSRKYDPDSLFQKGCVGGFKLNLDGAGST